MLPKLAEIFGTTTDALLGMEPETVLKTQAGTGGHGDGEEGFHYRDDHVEIHVDSGRRGTLAVALWVLLTGALLLANIILPQVVPSGRVFWPEQMSLWEIAWPSGLLAFGLVGLYPKFSFFRLGCALLGGYTLMGYFVGRFFNEGVLVPIVMVVFGLGLLVDTLRKPEKSRFSVLGGGKIHQSDFSAEGEGFLCTTSFGEDKRAVELPRLVSGEATVSFGDLTVDITGCRQIAPDARLKLECSFGSLTLCLPRTCRVEHCADTSFASVSFKGRSAEDAPDRIYLDCSVSFGEIEIVYI